MNTNVFSAMFNPENIKKIVKKRFPDFGVNKQIQAVRLLYEISKKENIKTESLLLAIPDNEKKFNNIKRYLMQRRFPETFKTQQDIPAYLPSLDINIKNKALIKKKYKFYPKLICIEESAWTSSVAEKFKTHFSGADIKKITSLKDYIKNKKYTARDYNGRSERVFIINEKYDFFKNCPCTNHALSCGYHIFNLGMGCAYECSYCYLQEYVNSPGMIIPANIESFLNKFKSYKQNIRIGTGEFTDSLALDYITGFSVQLVEFFGQRASTVFELKTKSSNVNNLLQINPYKNIVIAWSVNPQDLINENEFYSASLSERISAAEKCVKHGFFVAFHFDPIIYSRNWLEKYKNVINMIFNKIPQDSVRWISLGTLRFTPSLKKIIENRFPDNKILDEELFLGYDNKMRYSDALREGIYKKMIKLIREKSGKTILYLCMENVKMWKACGLSPVKKWGC